MDPDRFLGGGMRLDKDAAARATQEHIADPLGLDVETAAAGIRRIVDSQMADTLRELTIDKGHDPRDFTLYAYGGAGPLHCAGFGAELGVRQIVVPATSMVHSAHGALTSDVQLPFQQSILPTGRLPGRPGNQNTALSEESTRSASQPRCPGCPGRRAVSASPPSRRPPGR
ncbi:hydantoinase/oxoprolinase family protein [Streptomyces sp. NPDC044780]|uniref:hydantoinase/oxoprolinase family protein n=1 Tax=Streptomyces sp. NPDC044780 TaxID=3157199 RepID=UPI0033F75CD6